MSFTIMHRLGEMESEPASGWEERLLAELAADDPEHPDVAVSHETGWTLSAFPSGRVVWENVDDDHVEPRVARLNHPQLIEAFRLVASGDTGEVASLIRTHLSH